MSCLSLKIFHAIQVLKTTSAGRIALSSDPLIMCKEWLIYKYYSSCGRAQNGGPYHSHPTMCFKPCGRERKEYHSPQEVSLPPKERIAWRARSCRKCLDSIDDRRWWLEYGYGTGEVPKDPKNDDLFDTKGAPPRHQYAQASGSGARA